MATCFSYNSQAGDGVLHIGHLRPIIIKYFIEGLIKRPIPGVSVVVTASPTSITGSDEQSHWATYGVLITSSPQEFTGDTVQQLFGKGSLGHYTLVKSMIISDGSPYEVPESLGLGINKGKTKMYSDAAPISIGNKTDESEFIRNWLDQKYGNHEILHSSFEHDDDSGLAVEPSYLPTGADPMFAEAKLASSSSNQGHIYNKIHASPDQHCIDIPVQGQNMISGPDHAAGGRRAALMACVGEQAVAGVVANQIAAAGSNALALYFMVLAIMFGLTFKLAAVALKGNTRRQTLSIWMGKIGDMLTASAIILSLAMHLPPLMAWTAGPLAFLISALAVAFA